MCGIVGKIAFDGAPIGSGLIDRMCASIRHRGPDDQGTYVNAGIGLGAVRLAVLDLSSLGHQPMASEDGRLRLVFNGEIYNFRELRSDLEKRGYHFRSQTDSEVVLHLYEEYGTACLDKLSGMFAFAIWNSRDKVLFIARDRLGKKPLHYYCDDRVFVFSSEPKAILLDSDVSTSQNPAAIDHYMTFGYVPSPLSAFRQFSKLPPAHYLLLKNGSVRVERYWHLRHRPKTKLSEQKLCESLLERLNEAVRLRMISDVPIGALLSGGVDSAAIVALMSRHSTEPVRTFSIGFEESDYSELRYARLVADRFGTDHHEFIVKPDHGEEMLARLVWHYNEPYADSSALPSWYLARMARQHVTVALAGDGGDENFAGYSRYQVVGRGALEALPRFIKQGLAGALAVVPDGLDPRHPLRRGKRLMSDLSHGPAYGYARSMAYFSNWLKDELYTADFRSEVSQIDPQASLLTRFLESDTSHIVDAALAADIALYLPDDLLVKMDIASMANSLEVRSPLLDHQFVEFAATIPAGLKIRNGVSKYIFKKALEPLLPREIIERQKMGFEAPIRHWFRRELLDLTRSALLDSGAATRAYFRPTVVARLIDEHAAGKVAYHTQLWTLLMLEFWHRMFIDRTMTWPGPTEVVT